MKKRIVFVTGTRADFGKLKPLMHILESSRDFEVYIFITGMHLMPLYGYTAYEIDAENFQNTFKFINQHSEDNLDVVMAKTILGFSDFVNGISPDLIVVHGDRVEALAGATVGAFNNIIVAHVEGGEVSGTIDDLIRHAASKLSHAHFVANEAAAQRLRQLGEAESSIFIIGSPDIDVMNSTSLPTIDDMKTHYEIEFSEYAILIFHPVTTELEELGKKIDVITQFLKKSSHNFIIIYPNNDPGSRQILAAYESLRGCKNIKIFPSMRFEYFLTLLKNARFIIGNSSSGIREAPHFCIPAVNLGTRQNRRVSNRMVINSEITEQAIIASIEAALSVPRVQISGFGDGNSSTMFYKALSDPRFWDLSVQKKFVDLGDR